RSVESANHGILLHDRKVQQNIGCMDLMASAIISTFSDHKVNRNIFMSLTKETFDFLTDLSQNNHRDWFLDNKSRYERSWQELKLFVREIIGGLAAFDPHINTDIDPARCMFRIYRDVRFRKDKTPYKTWLGAGISV